MLPSVLLVSALTFLSSTAAALPLSPRQYGLGGQKNFLIPFNILVRPVELNANSYEDTLYLSQVQDAQKALAMHGDFAAAAVFNLKKGTLSTIFDSEDESVATTWKNISPQDGNYLTFTPATLLSQEANKNAKQIRIGGLGGALVLLSVDNNPYGFYFCSSKDGKTQYGLSVGKQHGKNVKCVNVYLEVAPVVAA